VQEGIVWTGFANPDSCLFQYTNRLAHLYFFRMILGIPAFLVNVHFTNDPYWPTDLEEWQTRNKYAGLLCKRVSPSRAPKRSGLEAGTETSKLPTPLRHGCNGSTSMALLPTTSTRRRRLRSERSLLVVAECGVSGAFENGSDAASTMFALILLLPFRFLRLGTRNVSLLKLEPILPTHRSRHQHA
jgi:hypothetical protein